MVSQQYVSTFFSKTIVNIVVAKGGTQGLVAAPALRSTADCDQSSHTGPGAQANRGHRTTAACFNPPVSRTTDNGSESAEHPVLSIPPVETLPAGGAAPLDLMVGDVDSVIAADGDQWAARMDVTQDQSEAAIRRVGCRVDDIAR